MFEIRFPLAAPLNYYRAIADSELTILKFLPRLSIQNFDDEDSLLDTESDVKPVFCRALSEIDGECGVKLAKCFTKSDSDQERIQHRFQLSLLLMKYLLNVYR